jgi:hypothetical protein
MKTHPAFKFFAVALCSTLMAFGACAQNEPAPAAAPKTAGTNDNKAVKPSDATDKPAPASAIADILKMLDAGVSKEVVKVFIENSTVPYEAAPADLIALKERGVSDEIAMAIMKRSAELKAQASQTPPANAAVTPAQPPVVNVVSRRLDPESYDYFEHYYLFPRTLASVNQTLGYRPSPFGYGGYYPGAYGYPRRFYPRGGVPPFAAW